MITGLSSARCSISIAQMNLFPQYLCQPHRLHQSLPIVRVVQLRPNVPLTAPLLTRLLLVEETDSLIVPTFSDDQFEGYITAWLHTFPHTVQWVSEISHLSPHNSLTPSPDSTMRRGTLPVSLMGNLPIEQESVALPVNSVTDTALNLNPNGTPSLMGNLPKGQESVVPPVNSVTDTALNLNPDGTPLTYRTAKSGPNRDHRQNAEDTEVSRLIDSHTMYSRYLHDQPLDRRKDTTYTEFGIRYIFFCYKVYYARHWKI
jgi:hypothetical protein